MLPKMVSRLTAARWLQFLRSTCSRIVISSPGARFASIAFTSRTSSLASAPAPRRGPDLKVLAAGSLPQRYVEKGRGGFEQGGVLGIFGDADHLQPAAIHLQPLSDRVLAAPEPLHHGFIHHGDRHGGLVIGAREFPARDQLDPQCREIPGPDLVVLDGRLLARLRHKSVDARWPPRHNRDN